jgi:hypothetical protein
MSNDVLLLLDCCCSMSCITKGSDQKFTHEVIGASGVGTPTPMRTFTPILCEILYACPQGSGYAVTQVHNLLLHKIKKPSSIHTFLFGQESIRLLPARNEQQLTPVRKKDVIVCIHLNEDLPKAVVDEFLDFLSKKPELIKDGCVKLLETRKTDSTLILVTLPIYLASLLSYVLDVTFLYLVD